MNGYNILIDLIDYLFYILYDILININNLYIIIYIQIIYKKLNE